ncbi:DNA-binding storekeeper protein-relatedtranscriptional regulator [Striga asiatica]|uniref:DNA-binding storekeeper protein-relatedtranscriptional regulator n=1 Tax=Striga asiatica TaxID=4170 RepID=A0A5A7PFX6_STRAF|nr:DNA-binding storekeeper protein-relatedtranscriptional regulator [Striga asiatica]
MSKARELVSSETSSGEEQTDDYSSEEIESEPEPIRKSSAPPAAARKPQTPSAIMPAPSDEDSESESESESEKKSRKKSKAKGKDKASAASASASAARSTRKRAVEEGKVTEPTVTKKLKNSKKAESETSEKKQLCQRLWRLWSQANEIASSMEFCSLGPRKNPTRMIILTRFFYNSEKMCGAEKENVIEKANGSGAEEENGVEKANGSGAEKENGVEKANGSGVDTNNIKDSVASERRIVRMRERLLSGLGNVPAVGDFMLKEGEWGLRRTKKLESEEMEMYVRHFEVKTHQAKLLLQMMKSWGH